jgi:membrane protein insertase, YidC/Oxa1 family, C-terminal domain
MISLILFAIFMKLVLFPLGIKQQKNSVKQASLRPKEMAIRKKYAGRVDEATKKKLNEEIMKLYQEENFNPASGCLPLLIQLPILYSLYYVITNPIEYILHVPINDITPFLEKAKTLSKAAHNQIDVIKMIINPDYTDKFSSLFAKTSSPDMTYHQIQNLYLNFKVFHINLLDVPTFTKNWLILIPILTFIFAFISTKIIRKFTYQPATDQAKTMAFMDWTMPLFSVYISFQVSAAVGIYWMAQNILGAVQQITLYKMFPIPQVSEEQVKEAELQLKGKSKKSEKSEETEKESVSVIEKAPLKKGKKKETYSVSRRKKGVSPKVRKWAKEGKHLKARKKI